MERVGEGGAYSFVVVGLSQLTIDHASLSRRSTVTTSDRDMMEGERGVRLALLVFPRPSFSACSRRN